MNTYSKFLFFTLVFLLSNSGKAPVNCDDGVGALTSSPSEPTHLRTASPDASPKALDAHVETTDVSSDDANNNNSNVVVDSPNLGECSGPHCWCNLIMCFLTCGIYNCCKAAGRCQNGCCGSCC